MQPLPKQSDRQCQNLGKVSQKPEYYFHSRMTNAYSPPTSTQTFIAHSKVKWNHLRMCDTCSEGGWQFIFYGDDPLLGVDV